MPPLLAGAVGLLLGLVLGAWLAGWVRRRGSSRAPAPATPPPKEQDLEQLAELGGRLAEVAHELGSPLTAILAFAEDLLRSEPTLEQREALLVIRHQAKRSRRLLRGLLDTLRGASPPGVRRVVDPGALARRVAQVFERTCAERGVGFACEVGPSLPPVLGEEEELEQVLTNLLQNACQATPAGGHIGLITQVRGRLLEFVVRDDGPGIPEDVIPRIFEPFYTTKLAGEGTGLGLAIAQDIVRRHRGILTAENVPPIEGGGSRFVVSLPFEDRRWRDRDAVPDEMGPLDTATAPVRRVLLVEDQQAVRLAVRRFLERRGWRVDEAGDGRAALAALLPDRGPCPYDVVVCDLRLPGLSGMAIYDRVVAEAPALRGRLVLVTGDVSAPDVAAFRARTGAGVLEKPYELELLAAALERVVRPAA